MEGHGTRIQYMSIRGQRSEVRRTEPKRGMSKDRGGRRKDNSDLMRGRDQRLSSGGKLNQ